MTQTLQQLCDTHPNGTPGNPTAIDLGSTTWPLNTSGDGDPQYPWFFSDTRHDLKLVGEGATVLGTPTQLQHRPICLVRGTNITFGAGITFQGNGPDPAHYSESHAFQHGIELAGAVGFSTEPGFKITNCWGSGVMVTRRDFSDHVTPSRWCSRLVLMHDSAHMGRQHVALDAVDGFLICGGTWTNSARSAVDIEPPGSNWGAKNGRWTNTTLQGGWTFALADLGAGAAGNVANIEIDHLKCIGTPLGFRIWAPATARRSNFKIHDCTSDTEIHIPAVDAMYVDGLYVRRLTQAISGGATLVRARNCTAVDTDCTTAYV